MRRLHSRRAVLFGATAAIVAAATGIAMAQSHELRGTVRLDGGGPIPEGQIEIAATDTDPAASVEVAPVRVASDGKAEAIDFSLPQTEDPGASPTLQIVARLERADGWLLARGSASPSADLPLDLILYPVMY